MNTTIEKNKTDIIWHQNGESDDDFNAVFGVYLLRCEQLSKNTWWWRVYFGDETIADATFRIHGKTKEEAMLLAEREFTKHYSLVNSKLTAPTFTC